MKRVLFTAIFLATFFVCKNSYTQVAINTTGALPHPSAILDVSSSDKGLLMPRLSSSEMNSITNPAQGLMVFNTTERRAYCYTVEDGWQLLNSDYAWTESNNSLMRLYGDDTLFTIANSGKVGIGKIDTNVLLNITDTLSSIGSGSLFGTMIGMTVDEQSTNSGGDSYISSTFNNVRNHFNGSLNNKELVLTAGRFALTNSGNATRLVGHSNSVSNNTGAGNEVEKITGMTNTITNYSPNTVGTIIFRNGIFRGENSSHTGQLWMNYDQLSINSTSKIDTVYLYKAWIPQPNATNADQKVWGLHFEGDQYNHLMGNLGLGYGVIMPSEKIEVEGNVLIHNGGNAHNFIQIGENTAANRGVIIQNGEYYQGSLNYQSLFSFNIKLGSGDNAHFEKLRNDMGAYGLRMSEHDNGIFLFTLEGSATPYSYRNLAVFKDDGKVGIGTDNPEADLHVAGHMKLEPQSDPPDSPSAGMLYYDSDDHKLKLFTGSIWENLN